MSMGPLLMLDPLSSAEAEYNACAFGLTAATHQVQIYNSLHGKDPDSPLTVALFTDSSSAVAMMANEKVNKRNRHIARRVHFVRDARISGKLRPYKIEGTLNPSDIGTKNLDSKTFHFHSKVLHVTVPP